MKKVYLSFVMLLFVLITQAQDYSISDYFYPMYKFDYTIKLAGNQSSFLKKQYKISNSTIGQFLETNTELYLNAYNHKSTGQEAFVLSKDADKNAIISDRQVYYNILTGPQERTDHLTLFILPTKDKMEKWFETNRGDKFSCTAELVDIIFDGFHLGQKATAVKITKITKLNKVEIKSWSYWLPNYSRIATFEQQGNGEIKVVEISDMIESAASIKEISKSLNLSYEESQKKPITSKRTQNKNHK